MTEAPAARPPRTPQEASVIRKMIGEPGAGLTGFGEWIQEVGRQNPEFDPNAALREITGEVSRFRNVVKRAMQIPEQMGETTTDRAEIVKRAESGYPLHFLEKDTGYSLSNIEQNIIRNAFDQARQLVTGNIDLQGESGKVVLADMTQKGVALSLAVDLAAFGLAFYNKAAPSIATIKNVDPPQQDLGMRNYLDRIINREWLGPDVEKLGKLIDGEKTLVEASASLLHLGRAGRLYLDGRMGDFLQGLKPEYIEKIDKQTVTPAQLAKKLHVDVLAFTRGYDDRIALLADPEYLGLVRELAGMTGQPDAAVLAEEAADESPFGKAAESLRQETERLARLGLESKQRLAAISHEVTELRRTINLLEHEALLLDQLSSPTAQALETLGAVQSKVDGVLADRERIAGVIASSSEFFGITAEEAGRLWPNIEDLFRLDPAAISSVEHIEFLLSKIPLFNKVYPKLEPKHTQALSAGLTYAQKMLRMGIPLSQVQQQSLKLVMDSLRSQLGEEAVKAGQATLDNLKFPEVVVYEEAVVAQIEKTLRETESVK